MLEKDPKNEFDPHAIRVRRLTGEDLGYVPKDLTVRFPHDVTFGHIHYVGQVPESGVWGALVTLFIPGLQYVMAKDVPWRCDEQGLLLQWPDVARSGDEFAVGGDE